MTALIECVPNFSEGRDPELIRRITDQIAGVEGAALLHVDRGVATNRTVVTFAGAPGPVLEAAFRAIRAAQELIDMRRHTGEHPRMGATDVCPLIPLAGITLEETAQLSRQLAERVGRELAIPVYLYEAAQSNPARRNLAVIRAGEYEGLAEKMKRPEWKPDFGPGEFVPRSGATVIGARDFLIAYNINLNTTSTRRANAIAFDVREIGRPKREGNPITGKVVTDAAGQPVMIPGTLKAVKAIGWYIEEYGIAQVSMNPTMFKWLGQALKENTDLVASEHARVLDRLRRDQDDIRERMKQLYLDHIDGKIDDDIFTRVTEDFRQDKKNLEREFERLSTADDAYIDDGIALLGIAKDARRMFAEADFAGKRNILNHILSNCIFKDQTVTATFRKPFDIIVESLPRAELAEALAGSKTLKSKKWLPG